MFFRKKWIEWTAVTSAVLLAAGAVAAPCHAAYLYGPENPAKKITTHTWEQFQADPEDTDRPEAPAAGEEAGASGDTKNSGSSGTSGDGEASGSARDQQVPGRSVDDAASGPAADDENPGSSGADTASGLPAEAEGSGDPADSGGPGDSADRGETGDSADRGKTGDPTGNGKTEDSAGSGESGNSAGDPVPGLTVDGRDRTTGESGQDPAPFEGGQDRQDPMTAENGQDPLTTENGQAPLSAEDGQNPAAPENGQAPVAAEAGIMEEWIPDQSGDRAGDNDQAFAAYVSREMDLSEDLRMGGTEAGISTPRKKSNYASNRLTGANRLVYGIMLEEVRRIAKGGRTDTRFYIPLEDIGAEPLSWTPEDLGVSSFLTETSDGKKKISDAAYAKVSEILSDTYGISARPVIKALLADCPSDLYWYEKTKNTSYGPGLSFYTDGSRLFFKGPLVFYLPVSTDYAALDAEGAPLPYETDPSCGTSVARARDNAAAIVDKYKDLSSDYEKLTAYKEEILDLTDYNRAAADKTSATPYGDPWQLIWVFDGDPETKVVCEGYSKAFQYLCDLSSFHDIFRECISVTGTMSGGSGATGHMWNIVMLRDGRNYMADITNCDNGMAGSGNGRSNLFLMGAKEAPAGSGSGDGSGSSSDNSSGISGSSGAADSRLADGSFSEGYTFHPYSGANIRYSYDEDSLLNFSEQDLTLAQGLVTASTTADGAAEITHSHIFITDPAVEATCAAHGLTEGSHCAICGYVETPQEETDTLPHTPDEDGWAVTLAPTGEREGVETTRCSVCGAEITRPVDRLVSLTDSGVTVSLNLPAGGYTYDGGAKRPPVSVLFGTSMLTENQDFTVSYKNNINAGAGTALVTITGKGSYAGTLTRTFSIGRAPQKLRLTASVSEIRAGFTAKVTASGAQGTTAYAFASSNTGIATVAGRAVASGRASATVTGRKAGTAAITVTTPQTANYQGGRASVTIRVKALTVPKPLQCRFLKWSDTSYGRCVIAWKRSDEADGYQTLLSWTDGSHAVRKETGPNVLQQTFSVPSNHVTQCRVRAFVRLADGSRKYSQWSNLTYITPSPAAFSCSKKTTSAGPEARISWNIIYGSSGYNIFVSTNPDGTWYWNQSTQALAGVTGAVIRTYRGSRLKKGQRYYVRIVTRRRRNGVFCTVPLPSASACAGSFCP